MEVLRETELQNTLLAAAPSTTKKAESLLIILFRLRNNMFHGEKEIEFIDGQNANFLYANKALKEFITM